ncbi:MAG: hypothetical protein WCI74_21440, partial [Actinomycetes bacterium]
MERKPVTAKPMNHHHRSFNPIHFMKANLLRCLAVMAAMTAAAHAQTINWGSDVDSVFIDSQGNTLDGSFVFELGAFTANYDPSKHDMTEWFANWHKFASVSSSVPSDKPGYSQADGYFSSEVVMTSGELDTLPAYLWIYNQKTMTAWGGGEWLLVRSEDWNFPTYGCCNPALSLEWSVSDLVPGDVPLYGYQKGTVGNQVGTGDLTYTSTSPGSFLQTATYLP